MCVGEILCTIHSKVFEDHQKELQPGAAIILRQVTCSTLYVRTHNHMMCIHARVYTNTHTCNNCFSM